MREEFEQLPYILDLMQYVTCFDGVMYISDNQYTADYLNGAWYAYQEQQKKIDGALDLACKHQYSNGERIYNEIKDILK